ncbi:MAG: HAD family hydrolase [Sphingobacterium sp.]
MINTNHIPLDKKLYLFELDDVLFPERDYLLQIYYLFAKFVEFSEGRALAEPLVDYMKQVYAEKGHSRVYALAAQQFAFREDYAENLERLIANGHLPLKLYLFNSVKLLLASILERKAHFAVLTKGNPMTQLNKLKYLDWQGLDQGVKIYFQDELDFRNIEPFRYIATENQVSEDEIMFINEPWTTL